MTTSELPNGDISQLVADLNASKTTVHDKPIPVMVQRKGTLD